eukprot:5130540-Ditylum_brightwellii.AAC.1
MLREAIDHEFPGHVWLAVPDEEYDTVSFVELAEKEAVSLPYLDVHRPRRMPMALHASVTVSVGAYFMSVAFKMSRALFSTNSLHLKMELEASIFAVTQICGSMVSQGFASLSNAGGDFWVSRGVRVVTLAVQTDLTLSRSLSLSDFCGIFLDVAIALVLFGTGL